jgi:poly(3-hydroxybutyrate) depolymerase
VPAGAPRRPALIVLFHGVGNRAEPFARFTGLARLADRRRLVLAAPEQPAPLEKPATYTRAGFATRLACELAPRVAAVVAVAGSYLATDACPVRGPRVALMEIHGDADPYFGTVPRLLGLWRTRDRCQGRAVVTHPRPGATRTAWRGCAVERVVLRGTRHLWPGAPAREANPTGFRATDAAWAFLSPRRRCGANVC